MADILAIYNKIAREIPPKWFDVDKIEQNANLSNGSLAARLLTTLARAVGRVADEVDRFFASISPYTASGLDLDTLLTSDYGRPRRAGESDVAYRDRIAVEVAGRQKTRAAIIRAVEQTIGRPPVDVVEGALDSFFLGHSFLGVNTLAKDRGFMRIVVDDMSTQQAKDLADALQGAAPGVAYQIEVRAA